MSANIVQMLCKCFVFAGKGVVFAGYVVALLREKSMQRQVISLIESERRRPNGIELAYTNIKEIYICLFKINKNIFLVFSLISFVFF